VERPWDSVVGQVRGHLYARLRHDALLVIEDNEDFRNLALHGFRATAIEVEACQRVQG